MYHCIVRNDDGEWSVGEVMTHPLNDYELKLTERRKQSPSQIVTVHQSSSINHQICCLHRDKTILSSYNRANCFSKNV